MSGINSLDETDPDVKPAEQEARDWLQTVLDKRWMPTNSLKLVFLRKEFEGRDVVRAKWTAANGSQLQLAQTRSLLALKVIPASSFLGKGSILSTNQVRALLFDLVRSNAILVGPKDTISFDDLKQVVLFCSVETARITHEPGTLEIFGDPNDYRAEMVCRSVASTCSSQLRLQMKLCRSCLDRPITGFGNFIGGRMVTPLEYTASSRTEGG
jgi:hypothetical protein